MADDAGLELQTHLSIRVRLLAERITELAHIAAAMHQFESLKQSNEHYGQRVAIGGAGPVSPGAAEDSRLPHRPPRGEAVTDDETPAPPPPPSTPRYTGRFSRHNPAD